MPDFFRGEDVLQKFGSFPPPGGVPAVVEWFNSRAPFDKVIQEIGSIVIPYLKEQGACKAIGGVGFCWGGNVCIQGARKLKDLKAIAALHSNIQTKEDVVDVKGLPMYIVGQGPVSIIVAYDIFGFKENPRTREVCDEIASKVGARVVMPDFFRGEDVLQKFGSFPPPGGVPA